MNHITAVVSSLAIFTLVIFGIVPAASSYMVGTHARYLHCPHQSENSYTNEFYITIDKESNIESCVQTNSCYLPQVLVVDCYSKVTWQNNDTNTHLISSGSQDHGPDGWFASSILSPGEIYSYIFERPGIYSYYDPIHSWAEGTIIVKSGNTDLDSEWLKFVNGPNCTLGEPNCIHPSLK
ncbi:MAG: cupredoxin domain-containing protein [Nitrosotalea sp.]